MVLVVEAPKRRTADTGTARRLSRRIPAERYADGVRSTGALTHFGARYPVSDPAKRGLPIASGIAFRVM